MGSPGGGAGGASMAPAPEPSVMTSPVALSVSATAISGEERGSVRVAAVATARANSTKNPSPRIDPRERPADPGWNGKEGTTSGIKNEENPRSVGPKNPLFFLYSPINAEPGEQRSLHRYL